jgi:hypothetical protein
VAAALTPAKPYRKIAENFNGPSRLVLLRHDRLYPLFLRSAPQAGVSKGEIV